MFLKKSISLIGMKKYLCWKSEDNGNAVNSFYIQELQKTEQDGLIIEKVLKQKATSYLWSGKTMILFSITGYKNDICQLVYAALLSKHEYFLDPCMSREIIKVNLNLENYAMKIISNNTQMLTQVGRSWQVI